MGYTVWQRVVEYYSDNPVAVGTPEDAFDMRKPLKRDVKRVHVRENGENTRVNPEDIWHNW